MHTLTCPVCMGVGDIYAYTEYDTGAHIEAVCYECGGMGIVEGYDNEEDIYDV